METRKPESPFGIQRKRVPQFSVKTIFLVMMVVAIASTVIVAALRTPDIASELSLWGGSNNVSTPNSRYTHLIFLLLCYCSTMMLALIVQIATRANAWYLRRLAKRPDASDSQDPFGD